MFDTITEKNLTKMTPSMAYQVIRDFGFFDPDKDLVTVERVPENWAELASLLKAVEILCDSLEEQNGYIVTLYMGVSESFEKLDVTSAWNAYMEDIPEWAGINVDDLMEFVEVIANSWGRDPYQVVADTLDGISYCRRYGWGYNN